MEWKQREMKVRAWDTEKKVWMEHTDVTMYDCHQCAIEYGAGVEDDDVPEDFKGYLDSDRFIVVQYTGLKDKNGKEVYEGDIWRTDKENVGNPWLVEYYDEHPYLMPFVSPLNCAPTEGEVIGNIFENPTLLEA